MKISLSLSLAIIALSVSVEARSAAREDAYRLHVRLAGVPPRSSAIERKLNPSRLPILDRMESLLQAGRAEDAARLVMDEVPTFYTVVLKNWIKPWSNAERSNRVALNDYVATVMGVIRDEIPFDQILYGDVLYTINVNDRNGALINGQLPYATTDFNQTIQHYSRAEAAFPDDLHLRLVRGTQSQLQLLRDPVNSIPEIKDKDGKIIQAARDVFMQQPVVAGVTTSHQSGRTFFSGGTNRRTNRHIFMNYLCNDYEDLHDTTVPDIRVRRDVERDAGGDSRIYKNSCVGCHAGQDALGGAYAHLNGTAQTGMQWSSRVQGKMNQNILFKDGFITEDDSWINLWASGQNARLGWRGAMKGRGPASLGRMFTRSRAFSECMAKRVFNLVCQKSPSSSAEVKMLEENANAFEANDEYNMKKLIVRTSAGCVNNE